MNSRSGDKLKQMSSSGRTGHFSMMRGLQLADFFTLGNAACGVAAVFFAMLYIESRSDGGRVHI
jgi:CDP-diacylglycerol---serine O-phosphatidyltransferase